MNTPQRYCCTLEQSKRLRELGVDAPSMFAWTEYENAYGNKSFHISSTEKNAYGKTNQDGRVSYPAYSVGEFGEMLPMKTFNFNTGIENNQRRRWYIMFGIQCAFEPTEAQARAAMLIYLLENSLITPQQVNNQLK